MVSFGLQGGQLKVELRSSLALCRLRNGIATRSAARRTTQICNCIAGTAGTSPPPSEAELFGALICVRNTRRTVRQRDETAMSRAWTSDPRLLARATSERPMC